MPRLGISPGKLSFDGPGSQTVTIKNTGTATPKIFEIRLLNEGRPDTKQKDGVSQQ